MRGPMGLMRRTRPTPPMGWAMGAETARADGTPAKPVLGVPANGGDAWTCPAQLEWTWDASGTGRTDPSFTATPNGQPVAATAIAVSDVPLAEAVSRRGDNSHGEANAPGPGFQSLNAGEYLIRAVAMGSGPGYRRDVSQGTKKKP